MIEFSVSFFIFITIFIDSLSLTTKAVDLQKRFASAYVVSQALTYIARLSLFFILPIIGLILDGVVEFDLRRFLLIFSAFLFLHTVLLLFYYKAIRDNSKFLIYYFSNNLGKFFFFLLFQLFVRAEAKVTVSELKVLYLVSHIFLSLIFPVVLVVGTYNLDYRAVLMGSISAYTGVFSLYILFKIERKIPGLSRSGRNDYIGSLIFSKVISTFIASAMLAAFSLSVM